MSSSTAALIDDPSHDTASDNIDAVQVQQEIQRLASARQADEGEDEEETEDEYLEQYELDSDEEDEYLMGELGVEDLNIEDEDWEVADGGEWIRPFKFPFSCHSY